MGVKYFRSNSFITLLPCNWYRGDTVVKVLCYKSEGRWFDSIWCHWNFSLTQSFRSHYGPGVDSASRLNEYQGDVLEVKCGRSVRLTTLPPSSAVVKKSGNLNFLEHSGPLQACNGITLPFYPNSLRPPHSPFVLLPASCLNYVEVHYLQQN